MMVVMAFMTSLSVSPWLLLLLLLHVMTSRALARIARARSPLVGYTLTAAAR